MKYSVLSIPGLPSSFAGLDSRFYHDPYPFLGVIRDCFGSEEHFESYLWPGDTPLPTSRIIQKIPIAQGLCVYAHYIHNLDYRKKVVKGAREHILRQLEQSDVLFVVAHSHGNKVFVDAMDGFELPTGKKIVWLAQAPAFRNVIYGLAAPKVSQSELSDLIERCDLAAFFRVKTDILSGDPTCPAELFFEYKPSWREFMFMAHATVRDREDILFDLRKLLDSKI